MRLLLIPALILCAACVTAADAPVCTKVAADAVPAAAKTALDKAGATGDVTSCTVDGTVYYCASTTGEKAKKVVVDANGKAVDHPAKDADCGGCCDAEDKPAKAAETPAK
jgi:hypothetical protein